MHDKKFIRWAARIMIVLLASFLIPTIVHAGLIEDLQGLGDGSNAQPDAVTPAVPTPALVAYTAKSRVNGTLNTGGCPDFSLSTCSGTNCAAVQFSGPVTSTAPGAGTISGCLTFNDVSSDKDFSACFNGAGNATLTASSGAAVNVILGGQLCEEQVVIGPPPTLYFEAQMAYQIKGGAGAYANAVGVGEFDMSFTAVNPVSVPFSGAGLVSLTGNYAKH